MSALANDVRLTAEIVERIKVAGIGEDDPDFAILVEAECDGPERVRRILRAARHSKAQAEALSKIIEDDTARRKRLEKQTDALRGFAAWMMGEMGLTKISAPDFDAVMRKGKPGLVGGDKADGLPDRLCRIRRDPDRVAIRKALEDGETVPGFEIGNAEPVLTLVTR